LIPNPVVNHVAKDEKGEADSERSVLVFVPLLGVFFKQTFGVLLLHDINRVGHLAATDKVHLEAVVE